MVCIKFQKLILESSKIMRKILIEFEYSTKLEEVLSFLDNYGTKIKNINSKELELVPILKRTPNLEMLESGLYNSDQQGQFDLPNLKFLSLCDHLSIFRDVKNLETLIFCLDKIKLSEDLTNFIVRLKNLKNLEIYNGSQIIDIPFPTRDISNECEFKLTKFIRFNHYTHLKFSKNLEKFIVSQLKSLQEIEIFNGLNSTNFNFILKYENNGEILNNLVIRSNKFLDIVSMSSIRHTLSSAKFYAVSKIKPNELNHLIGIVPNIISLCSYALPNINSPLFQLEILRIDHLELNNILRFLLPNLKKLVVQKFYQEHNEKNLEIFCQNSPNIEVVGFDIYFLKINLKYLKYFKNLKKLEITSNNTRYLVAFVNFSEKIVYYRVSIPESFHELFPNFQFKQLKVPSGYNLLQF